MARARNIKPGFFTNDELVELPFEVRLLFIGLWTIADREGRLIDRPKKIKMEIFPADNVDCDSALSMLEKSGFVLRYEAEGTKFIQIVNWCKHQNPHVKEAHSIIPSPWNNHVGEGKEGYLPEQNHASTIQAPVNTQPLPERAGLIPDSLNLIPDSGYRIAEAPRDAGAENPAARATGAVAISIAMRAAGIATQPANPILIALAEQGVTPETATAACEEAKRAKPNEKIGAGYVFKIIERWAADASALKAAGAAAPKSGGAWWVTDATIAAKGSELSMAALPGETMMTFKGRIQSAIDNGGKPLVAKSTPLTPIEPEVSRGQKPEGFAPLKSLIKIREHA